MPPPRPLYPQERTPGPPRPPPRRDLRPGDSPQVPAEARSRPNGSRAPETTELRAVVSWEGPGEPIMLTLYGPAGEVAVPMVPKRALTLAQELLTRGVQAIKVDWPG